MGRAFDHVYILATVLFAVYSQLVMRWQVSTAGPLPPELAGKAGFIAALLLNPWVLSGLAATFLSGVAWMMAMTKFEISYAYPFIGLNFILVPAAGVLLFGEGMNAAKLGGTALVVLGIIVIARS